MAVLSASVSQSKSDIDRQIDRQIDRTFREYYRTHARDLRDRLIEHFLPTVRRHAERLSPRFPVAVQVEDLTHAGVLGLMDAIESFDPDQGVKFETYSAPRIWGAMLDELRSLDWVPRLVRTHAKKLARARARLRSELGREPNPDEVRDGLGLSDAEYRRHLIDAAPAAQISFSSDINDDGEMGPMRIDAIVDRGAPDPARSRLRAGVREEILRGLTRSERLLVMLYYYEELTFREIGRTLELSESRISQMHTTIVRRTRARMRLTPEMRAAAVA